MNIIIATAHSKQLAAMLDVKFTSSSMDEKQYFAFLAACCRFWNSKFHLGHWIEVRETSFKSIVPQFYKSNHFPSFFHWTTIVNWCPIWGNWRHKIYYFSLEIIWHRYEYTSQRISSIKELLYSFLIIVNFVCKIYNSLCFSPSLPSFSFFFSKFPLISSKRSNYGLRLIHHTISVSQLWGCILIVIH